MRHVYPLDCLIEHAISRPLGSWCLLLTFAATADEEADFSMMSFTIPWHRQANLDLETLRCDGFALIACEEGPVEAFRLLGALRGRRVGVRVFDPEGRSLPVEVSTSPDAQKLFGVYPTPRPLARWVVRSVDDLLRGLLEEREGLATSGLHVLDPAAGPMNFILEAYRRAIAGWRVRNGRAGLARLVREHLVPDFQGIEILADRWAAGHQAVGDYLRSIGLDLAPGERVPLFLADALSSPDDPGAAVGFLGEQAARAGRIKSEEPVTVILGNPPYNGRPTRKGAWISDLLQDYFQVDGKPLKERNPKWLLDDYVKFLRLAQWVIERQGAGIVAFVVNHNCLEAPTFRGLRRSLLRTFDRVYALDLHGNARKQVEGQEDGNVFEGVAQGVAVLLLVKRPGLERKVFRGDLHGTRESKLRALARSPVERLPWAEVKPRAPLWLFRPSDAQRDREFRKGLPLPEIFPLHSLGVVTGRDAQVLALDRGELETRLQAEGSGSCRRFLSSFLARPFDLRHALYLETILERLRIPAKATTRSDRRRPPVGAKRRAAAHVSRSGRLGASFPVFFFPCGFPRRRGCGSCGNPGRGWAGAQDFQGVWEGPGVGGWRPGAFHTPAASIAGVGGSWGGGGRRRRGAPRSPHEGSPAGGAAGVLVLRMESPLSFSS